MRLYVDQYRPFLVFLAKFFLTYILLAAGYRFYLSGYNAAGTTDPATSSVAWQSEKLLALFGQNIVSEPHPFNPYIKLIFNGQYVARIIEGCNAISVMILFAAFVVAFKGKVRDTIFFIISGCLVIHILNIVRIALLCAAMYHYPEYEHFLHGVVFPLFIYSVVFLLWVIWVNKFSLYVSRIKEK